MAARAPGLTADKVGKKQDTADQPATTAEESALNNIKDEIIPTLDAFNLAHMRCFPQPEQQRIHQRREQRGHAAAAKLLCELVVKKEGWWSQLLETLRSDHVKQGHIATKLETELARVLGKPAGLPDDESGGRKKALAERNRKRKHVRVVVSSSSKKMKHYMRDLEDMLFDAGEKSGDQPHIAAQKAKIEQFNERLKGQHIFLESISRGSIISNLECETSAGLSQLLGMIESGEFAEVCADVFNDEDLATCHGFSERPTFDVSVNDEDVSLCRGELRDDEGKKLFEAVKAGEISEVKDFLRDKTDPNWQDKDKKKTCLFVVPPEASDLVPLLVAQGAYLEQLESSTNWTPLQFYCRFLHRGRHTRTIEQLVRAGANVNHENVHGGTALHNLITAATTDPSYDREEFAKNMKETVSLLVLAGADLTLRSKRSNDATAKEYVEWERSRNIYKGEVPELLKVIQDMLHQAEQKSH